MQSLGTWMSTARFCSTSFSFEWMHLSSGCFLVWYHLFLQFVQRNLSSCTLAYYTIIKAIGKWYILLIITPYDSSCYKRYLHHKWKNSASLLSQIRNVTAVWSVVKVCYGVGGEVNGEESGGGGWTENWNAEDSEEPRRWELLRWRRLKRQMPPSKGKTPPRCTGRFIPSSIPITIS